MVFQLQTNKNYLFIALLMIVSCRTTLNNNPSISSSTKNNVEKNEKVPDPKGLRHFMDGQLLMNQGDFAMAIIEFQEALTLDPKHGVIAKSYVTTREAISPANNKSSDPLDVCLYVLSYDANKKLIAADTQIKEKKHNAPIT